MHSCPYCGSKVIVSTGNVYYCDFCELEGAGPSQDGKRLGMAYLRTGISLEDAKKSTPELMSWHVFELLQLLKLLRDDRRFWFKQMSVFKAAGKTTTKFIESEKETERDYEWQTRKVWIVENIIREKVGYIPKAVTGKLLAQWYEKMEYDLERGSMTFNKKNSSQVK